MDDRACTVAHCSLREAINAANANSGDDTISFAANLTGTINLTGALPALGSDLTIAGPGAKLLTVRRDTGGNYRVFSVSSGATVTISDLTIETVMCWVLAAGCSTGARSH